MKVTVKTLKGEIYTIQVQPSTTILDVKNIITTHKNIAPDLQKVVFKGKNTTDADIVETLGVKEGDFFVVMFTNPKKDTKIQEPEKKAEQKKEIKQQKKGQKIEQNKSIGLSNAQYQNSINIITAMGFNRATAVAAMAAAFNDTNRAVQYCCNGIPNGNEIQTQDFEQQSAMQVEGEQQVDPAILQTILNSSQFVQIRQSFQNDPSSLPQLISQLSTSNPTLFSVISQYPDLFQQLLTGQLPDDMIQQDQEGEDEGSIQLNNEQNEAVNRLSALGFSKIQAVQAFLACDKNQELAANLLFDRQAKGDIEPGQGNDYDFS